MDKFSENFVENFRKFKYGILRAAANIVTAKYATFPFLVIRY
jgi:hypothetical protein